MRHLWSVACNCSTRQKPSRTTPTTTGGLRRHDPQELFSRIRYHPPLDGGTVSIRGSTPQSVLRTIHAAPPSVTVSNATAPSSTSLFSRLVRRLEAIPSCDPFSSSRKCRRPPKTSSDRMSRLHLSPKTSSDRLMGHPEQWALVIEPSGQLVALQKQYLIFFGLVAKCNQYA